MGRGYVGISAMGRLEAKWLDSMAKARASFPNSYLQAVKADRVLNERQLIFSLYNVLMAHEYGYSKMKRIDAELLLNLSGTNNFEEALAQLAPNEGDDVVVVSYSEDEKILPIMMEYFMKEVGARIQSLKANEKKMRYLTEIYGLGSEGELSEEMTLNFLAEESAIFYVRYR